MRLLLLAFLVACAPKPAPAPAPATEQATLPPAFDAATLRAGFVPGTVVRYRITEDGVTRVEAWTVAQSDEEGCTMHVEVFDADGVTSVEGSEVMYTSTWAELQSHGTFPAALTTRRASSVDVPAGHLDTVYYEVVPTEADGMTRKFHFAPVYVGPPVWAEFSQGGAVRTQMELLSRTGP